MLGSHFWCCSEGLLAYLAIWSMQSSPASADFCALMTALSLLARESWA